MLIHLSSKKYPEQDVNDINTRLALLKDKGNIDFLTLTYQDLVNQLTALRTTFSLDHQMYKLCDDFENYCREMQLLDSGKNVLRAMACGQSFNINVKHRFYFDLASRGFSDFEFLGIYHSKAVQYIGRVENEIVADWNSKSGLTVHSSKRPVAQEQEQRLSQAIQDALNEGWLISNDHRFFLMSDFAATDFRKTSPGGIFRVRYLKLEEHFTKVPTDIRAIASELKSQTWS